MVFFVLENFISDEVAATPVGLFRLLLEINYLIIVLICTFFCKAAFAATSKTSLTPVLVLAEHSR